MRRLTWAIVVLATWAATVRADEPDLLFVDQLRSAGLADVALEYLHRVAAAPPPALRDRLPLERARCLAALADGQDDATRRDRMRSAARAEIERWLRDVTDLALKVDARANLARICEQQGVAQLARSRLERNRSERQDAAARADALLTRSLQLLEATQVDRSKLLASLEEHPSAAGRVAELSQQIREASFRHAVATFHKAQCAIDPERSGVARRNAGMEAARRQFLEIGESDDSVGWEARAWVGRCWLELDNIGEARKLLAQVEREVNRPAAAAGVRAARFFLLLLAERDPGVRSRSGDVIRGASEWLDRYPDLADAADGQAVRLLLARHLILQAQASGQREPLRRAVDLLTALSELGRDLSADVGELRLEAADQLIGDDGRPPANFSEGYLAAQVELYRRMRLADGPAEGARSIHLRRAMQNLDAALALATPDDPARAIFDARLLVCYCHLLDGQPAAAAVLGEHLARTAGDSARGARAALYALSAWSNLCTAAQAAGSHVDEAAARRHVGELAGLIESRWADAPEADDARLQLGELAFAERRYADAAAHFRRVQPPFDGFAYAKYRQGVAAQLACAAGATRELIANAILELRRLEDLPVGASADAVRADCQARLQLATLLLLTGRAEVEAATISRRVATDCAKLLPDDETARRGLVAEAVRLWALAAGAQARQSLSARRFDQTRAALAPVIAHVRDYGDEFTGKDPGVPGAAPMIAAINNALAIDAIAAVRSGSVRSFRHHVALAGRLGGVDALVVQLAQELSGEDKSNSSVASAFEEVARRNELLSTTRLRIANGLSAIDEHAKAAAVLAAIPAPAAHDADGLAAFRAARLALAREYRLAKSFEQAKAILRDVIGTPKNKGWGYDQLDVRREAIALCADEGNFAGAVQMTGQVQKSLSEPLRDYEAKSARLRQLGGELGTAGNAPGALRAAALAERDQLEADLQRLAMLRGRYFEFERIEMEVLARYAETLDDAKGTELLKRLAARLVKLERAHVDLGGPANRAALADLLAHNPALRQQYLAAGGTALQTP